ADRDVGGQGVAAHPDHGSVPEAAIDEDGKVGVAAADIDRGHAQFTLGTGEERFAGSKRFEDDVVYFDPGALDALDQVVDRGDGAGDNMGLYLKAVARHTERIVNPVLAVYYV